MVSIRPATAGSKKRKGRHDVDDDDNLQPSDDKYRIAWNELKHRIMELDEHLAPSTLSPFDARQIFNLRQAEDVLWTFIDKFPMRQYLSDNIDRMLTVTSETYQTNAAFCKSIVDQILFAVIYNHKRTQTAKQRASSQPLYLADPVLEQGTHFQRQVRYGGETRLLDGYADYTVGYESQESSNLTTNLIIIRAKNSDSTDTCFGQLTAYMGIAHACRKDERKQSSTVYGAAFDGLSFRFCRIDDEGKWSRSRLMKWKMNDKDKIYSMLNFLIKIARPSIPCIFNKTSFQDRKEERACWNSKELWGRCVGGIIPLAFTGLEIAEEHEENLC